MNKDTKSQKQVLKSLGDNLRKTRKKKGYSQMTLAELASVDFSFYGAVERGEKAITVQKLSQISEALNISLSELFEDQPKKNGLNPDEAEKEEKLEKILALLVKRDLEDLTFVHSLLSKIFSWQKKERSKTNNKKS